MKNPAALRFLLLGLLLFPLFAFWPLGKKKKPDPLICAYFQGDGASGLHLAWSEDGWKWQPLRNGKAVMRPGIGEYVLRDPHLSQTPDGIFHLVWATGKNRRDVGYAWSKNLSDWSVQRLIPVMEKDSLVLNAWAPELVYDEDGKRFMLIWASTVPGKFRDTDRQNDSLPGGFRYNHRIYKKYSENLVEWGPTESFFEPGFNVTDPHVATDSGRVMLFYKDATAMGKNIQNSVKMSTSGAKTGGFSTTPQLVTRRTWAEAPMSVRIDSQYVVYFSKYRNKKFGAVVTKDFKKWKDISDTISFPKGMVHGSVLRLPEKVLEKLKE